MMDEIDDVVNPETNSIKETRIDGLLDKKLKWNGAKWVNVCRHSGCKEEIFKNSLCTIHYKEQIKINILDEIVKRNGKSYIWTSGKEWKLLCSTELCRRPATKQGKCTQHNNNPVTMFSSQESAINIFHDIKKEMEINKQKLKKEQKKLDPRLINSNVTS